MYPLATHFLNANLLDMAQVKKKSAKDYRHGDLKSALIECAIGSIAKTGEVDFSLRDLAKRTGVTHAAAYRHFPSKKDILIAIAEQGYLKLSESFKKILSKNVEDIEGLGIAYVRFAIENPYHFKVMFHPDVKTQEPNNADASLGYQTFSYLLSSVEANKKRGKFIDQDSHLIAMSAWSGVHGLATLIVNDNLEKKMKISPLIMAKIMTSHFMSGFLKRLPLERDRF